VKPWQRHKVRLALAVLVVGALAAWFSMRDSGAPKKVAAVPTPDHADNLTRNAATSDTAGKPAFDFYLLALTVHPAFCADGRAGIPECRTGAPRPLVIHGLWPERLAPRTYPHDCPAKALDLDPALEQELSEWMPGMAANLHEHEWREHGGCSGLDDDDYFRLSIDLARGLDGALRARLTTLAGQETTAVELREIADQYQPGVGATFTLHCRTLRGAPVGQRDQPFLVEIRQCVDNDGPNGAPGSLLDCARLPRHDQGCGAAFRIAGLAGGT
jgi:ribonuclease I